MKDLFGNDDLDAIFRANVERPLEDKITLAIRQLQDMETMALSFKSTGYHVAFSGGKDSQVCAELCKMANVKHTLNYSNVTLDPPELIYHIRKHYQQTIWHNKNQHMLTRLVDRAPGLATRKIRWCCEEYKHACGDGAFTIVGVRALESARRKGLWTEVKQINNGVVLSIILHWTDDDVWTFLKFRNIPYCSLYDEGFKRLGCVGCGMTSKANKEKEFARWPRYEAMYKRQARKWWEKYSKLKKKDGEQYYAAKFATFEDYWNWWMENGESNSDEPDCQLWLW